MPNETPSRNVGAFHTLGQFFVIVNNLAKGTDILLIEYKSQIDFRCDFCTSKLSDFIDDHQKQPKSLHQAAVLADLFGWSVKGVAVKCPTCV